MRRGSDGGRQAELQAALPPSYSGPGTTGWGSQVRLPSAPPFSARPPIAAVTAAAVRKRSCVHPRCCTGHGTRSRNSQPLQLRLPPRVLPLPQGMCPGDRTTGAGPVSVPQAAANFLPL